ncbi:MAG: DUF4384 domain-containing protein [bacterium]
MTFHLQHLHRQFMKNSFKRLENRFVAFFLLLLAVFFSSPAAAHDPFDIDLKVWSSQSFDDPFCSDDPIDIYFRVDRLSYITVYQINPYGGVEILYPRSHHRWSPVFPRRTYRLIDLATDLDFFYNGLEGSAYIGVIATRQPIDVVPWLEAGFRDCGLVFGRPSRVAVGVDFHFAINRVLTDVRIRLGTACAPAFYVAPIYVRPRVAIHRRAVWPKPRYHKSYSPNWRWDYDKYPTHPQPEPEPEKRPFRRRGFESSEPAQVPYSPKPVESRKQRIEKRHDTDRKVSKKSDTVKVKNETDNSEQKERRAKKTQN